MTKDQTKLFAEIVTKYAKTSLNEVEKKVNIVYEFLEKSAELAQQVGENIENKDLNELSEA